MYPYSPHIISTEIFQELLCAAIALLIIYASHTMLRLDNLNYLDTNKINYM